VRVRGQRQPRRRTAGSALTALLLLCGLLVGTVAQVGPTSSAAQAATVVNPSTFGRPSWWSGDCDTTRWGPLAAAQGWKGAASHRLGASYLGIPVCGPRPAIDGSPDIQWGRTSWGEAEWECVELAQRFMAQVYGVAAYGANGVGVVSNYRTSYGGNLVTIANGTAGRAPVPGDIVSFRTTRNIYGHVAVIASSTVDASGNGSVTMLSQNDTPDGWRTLAVVAWRLQAFGSLVPYGWLHDPAGRGNPLGEGAFIRVTGRTGTWRIIGGAPVVVGSWQAFGGLQPYSVIEPAQFARLRAYPADGTYMSDTATRTVYRVAGGAPLAIAAADVARLPGWGRVPIVAADHYAFAHLDHMRATPLDHTQVCRVDVNACYLVAGGSPMLVPAYAVASVPGWKAKSTTYVSGLEFSSYQHLRPTPADGTFLCDGGTSTCYRTAGGAPLALSPTDNPVVPGSAAAHALTLPHWEFANFVHLSRYPANGTVLCPVGQTGCYVVAGRAPLPVTAAAARSVPTLSTATGVAVSPYELAHPTHLATRPVDGTALVGAQSRTVYVVRSGVATYLPPATAADLTVAPVVIDQAAVDNAGLGGAWAHLLSAPAALRLTSPTLTVMTASTAAVRWTRPVASSAITSYTVRYKATTAAGAFGQWTTPAVWARTTTTGVYLSLSRGHDYCVQVRATNRAGQVGPWSPARCTTAALDDRASSATSLGWRRDASSRFYAGSALTTTRHGAWWRSTTVTLDRVGVVATTCPGCGAVRVLVNGVSVGVISLVSPTTRYQQVLVLPPFSLRTGTVTLAVISPAGRPVQLDGVVLTRI
jgi:hypothetical protein